MKETFAAMRRRVVQSEALPGACVGDVRITNGCWVPLHAAFLHTEPFWRERVIVDAATHACTTYLWLKNGRKVPNHCYMLGRSNPGPQARCAGGAS